MESGLLDRPRRHHTNPPDLDRLRRHHTDRPCRHHADWPRRHHTNRPCRHHRGQPPTLPACLEIPDTSASLRRAPQETRQGYRPVAPIQRFNNKSLNWPAWFRHFRAVADVHGWDKNQRALQLVSYLDETAMNVAQELGDDKLYLTFW